MLSRPASSGDSRVRVQRLDAGRWALWHSELSGFHVLSGQLWIDALLNSAMLLGGMGPVGDLGPTERKTLRVVLCALLRLVFLIVAGLLFMPVFHLVLHRFHLDASSRQVELTASLSDAVQVTQRSHDDDAVGDRGRRHDHFLHVVLRDLRQTWPGGEDVDLAVFARNVQTSVGGDR